MQKYFQQTLWEIFNIKSWIMARNEAAPKISCCFAETLSLVPTIHIKQLTVQTEHVCASCVSSACKGRKEHQVPRHQS